MDQETEMMSHEGCKVTDRHGLLANIDLLYGMIAREHQTQARTKLLGVATQRNPPAFVTLVDDGEEVAFARHRGGGRQSVLAPRGKESTRSNSSNSSW